MWLNDFAYTNEESGRWKVQSDNARVRADLTGFFLAGFEEPSRRDFLHCEHWTDP